METDEERARRVTIIGQWQKRARFLDRARRDSGANNAARRRVMETPREATPQQMEQWRIIATLLSAAEELRPHRREDRLTKIIPIAYDPKVLCPTWERYLYQVMDLNEETGERKENDAYGTSHRRTNERVAEDLVGCDHRRHALPAGCPRCGGEGDAVRPHGSSWPWAHAAPGETFLPPRSPGVRFCLIEFCFHAGFLHVSY